MTSAPAGSVGVLVFESMVVMELPGDARGRRLGPLSAPTASVAGRSRFDERLVEIGVVIEAHVRLAPGRAFRGGRAGRQVGIDCRGEPDVVAGPLGQQPLR